MCVSVQSPLDFQMNGFVWVILSEDFLETLGTVQFNCVASGADSVWWFFLFVCFFQNIFIFCVVCLG